MSDESSDADTNDVEEPQTSNKLYIAIATILILACAIAVIILVVYFGVLAYGGGGPVGSHPVFEDKDKSKRPSARKSPETMTELQALAQRIEVVVDRFLNFSEADKYCKSLDPPKQLFFPLLAAEEEALEEKMSSLIPDAVAEEPNSKIRKDCGSDFMLGMRKSLDRDWKTYDDEYLFGQMFLPDMFKPNVDSSEHCLGITNDMGKLRFRAIDCDISDGWNCVLCQYQCDNSSSGFCYNIHENKFRTDLGEATEYCSGLELPSSIAVIKHKSVLEEVSKQVKLAMRQCETVGIGHWFARNYESIHGIPMSYQTQQILYRSQRNASHNCIGVTIDTQFKWEPMDCAGKHCFVCN